jgi:hypothetical protein
MPKHFRQLFVLMMALIWVPMTAHCQLENVPGLEFLKCLPSETKHSTPDPSGHCGDDACYNLESGAWRVENFQLDATIPPLIDQLSWAVTLLDLAVTWDASAYEDFTTNADLPKLKRVIFRTVLAARPPPIAS